jgi:broad specificity phosphatase PhoE
MTTFLLIRHAETDSIGKTLAGWTDGVHLNEQGRQQAKRLGRQLSTIPIRAVYTSPISRAFETAEFVAEPHGLTPQIRDDFGEFRFGAWEGMSISELDKTDHWRRFNTCRSTVGAPGGELMLEAQTRMARQMNALTTEHNAQHVAVVSHADPLRSLISFYLGIPLDLGARLEISVASVTTIELGDRAPRVLSVNTQVVTSNGF